MKKGNAGVIVLITILFVVLIAFSVGMLIWNTKLNEEKTTNNGGNTPVENTNNTDEGKTTNSGNSTPVKTTFKKYSKGDIVTIAGNSWLVVNDSDSNNELVKLYSIKDYDYVNNVEYAKRYGFEEFSSNIAKVGFAKSVLRTVLEDEVAKLPIRLCEVNGSKVTLLTINELKSFDPNWSADPTFGSYTYTGSGLKDYFKGIMLADEPKCDDFKPDGPKCLKFYSVGTRVDENSNIEYLISIWAPGLTSLHPVITVYKDSIK